MAETEVLSAEGFSKPVSLRAKQKVDRSLIGTPPSILCKVSDNSALRYTIEVSYDEPEPLTWQALDMPSTNLKASCERALGIVARSVRVNVTRLSAGSIDVMVRDND